MAIYKKYVKIKEPNRLVLTDLPFEPGHVVEVVVTDQTDGAPVGPSQDARTITSVLGNLLSPLIEIFTP
jgi:hypothetical protein